MDMSPRNLTAALDAARWLKPPRRPTPCREGHDPKYSHLVGRLRPIWICAVCRKQWERRRAEELATEPWRPTPAQAERFIEIRQMQAPTDRLKYVTALWLEIVTSGGVID